MTARTRVRTAGGERVTLWNLVREERIKVVATAPAGSPGDSTKDLHVDLVDVQVRTNVAHTQPRTCGRKRDDMAVRVSAGGGSRNA